MHIPAPWQEWFKAHPRIGTLVAFLAFMALLNGAISLVQKALPIVGWIATMLSYEQCVSLVVMLVGAALLLWSPSLGQGLVAASPRTLEPRVHQ